MVDWKGHRAYWVNFYPTDGGVIDYQLVAGFDATALATFDAKRPQNILSNSSFELGREGGVSSLANLTLVRMGN